MEKKIGFIGCGNMASAMIGGIVGARLTAPGNILASNPTAPKLEAIRERLGIRVTADNRLAARQSDILVLAVKPYLYEDVISEICDVVQESCVVILIAAGQSLAENEKRFGRPVKLARAMPNTPALVGEGMTALCFNDRLSQQERDDVQAIFESFGRVELVSESLMHAVSGVSGSSPAYAYLFLEALADGAVREGMPRAQAVRFAAQAVLGAAKMVLATGKHPGALKDAVCSPGGTTIEAIASLEQDGLRSAVIRAVHACTEKSRSMEQ